MEFKEYLVKKLGFSTKFFFVFWIVVGLMNEAIVRLVTNDVVLGVWLVGVYACLVVGCLPIVFVVWYVFHCLIWIKLRKARVKGSRLRKWVNVQGVNDDSVYKVDYYSVLFFKNWVVKYEEDK